MVGENLLDKRSFIIVMFLAVTIFILIVLNFVDDIFFGDRWEGCPSEYLAILASAVGGLVVMWIRKRTNGAIPNGKDSINDS